jgi:hypothetical protein
LPPNGGRHVLELFAAAPTQFLFYGDLFILTFLCGLIFLNKTLFLLSHLKQGVLQIFSFEIYLFTF